jgi:acetylglutamate kinase
MAICDGFIGWNRYSVSRSFYFLYSPGATVESAEILHFAGAAIQSARSGMRVVKLGGSAMEDPTATAGMIRAVVTLQRLGLKLVLVHGGGKPIDRAMAAAGLTPVKVAGRRYTDDATLAVVVRVLTAINAELVAALSAAGATAYGFGADPVHFPLRGERLLLPGLDLQPVDLGRVGSVTAVVERALREPGIPLLPSLAVSPSDGGWPPLQLPGPLVPKRSISSRTHLACCATETTPGASSAS